MEFIKALPEEEREKLTSEKTVAINGVFKPVLSGDRLESLKELFLSTPGGEKLTDNGNSIRFAAMHKDKLRYCPAFKNWLIWDDRRWRQDELLEVRKAADSTVRAIAQMAATLQDSDKRTAWLSFAAKNEALAKRLAMIEGAKHLMAIAPTILDVNPWLFNCENGTLDLRTGELRPHSPEDYLTKIAPVCYDQAATCPRFDQFLDEVFPAQDNSGPDRELIRFVQKLAGYALVGVVTEQIICISWGIGANGKSTLFNLLAEIMGDYAATTPMDTFLDQRNNQGATNDLAALRGARLVIASEAQAGQRLNESLIKKLTGGELITARHLYQDFFSFLPQFLTVMMTNHKPKAKADDEAIWRRLRLIPFLAKFDGASRDNNLTEKLKQERSGIFRWMVDGCRLWQEEGLKPPASVELATGEYRSENDPFADWLEERCTVAEHLSAKTTELREDYQRFLGMRGKMNPRLFTNMLKSKGFEVYTSMGVSKTKGIQLAIEDAFRSQLDSGEI